MNCPYCNQSISTDQAWDFFECSYCRASLQCENGAISLLKEPDASSPVSQNSDHQEENKDDLSVKTSQKEAIVSVSESSLNQSDQSSETDLMLDENHPEDSYSDDDHSFNQEIAGVSATNTEETHQTLLEEESSTGISHHQSVSDSQLSVNKTVQQTDGEESDHPVFQKNHQISDLSSHSSFEEEVVSGNHFDYEIYVSEIPSSEILSQIQSLLKIKELNLKPSQVVFNTQEDQLRISSLNAIQAMYLVKRLSVFFIQMSWCQKSKIL